MRNFATIAYPLNRLLRKDVKFKWEEEEESAFHNLKARPKKAPILTYPDFSKEFFLACDASNVGIGAVLLQKGEKRLMPLAYASRTLNSAERSYRVTEKESLAVIFGLRKFWAYHSWLPGTSYQRPQTHFRFVQKKDFH